MRHQTCKLPISGRSGHDVVTTVQEIDRTEAKTGDKLDPAIEFDCAAIGRIRELFHLDLYCLIIKCFLFLNRNQTPYILMRVVIPMLLFSAMFFLTGCPKNDPDPQKSDNRVPLTGKPVLITFERDTPDGVECGKPFEIKGIPFLIEKKTNDNTRCYYPDEKYSLRIGWGSEVTIDFSKYNNIKSITINVSHTNVYGGHDGSEVILYDLDDKIISQSKTKKYDQNNNIRFNENLSNIKKVVIRGWGEVTDIRDISIS